MTPLVRVEKDIGTLRAGQLIVARKIKNKERWFCVQEAPVHMMTSYHSGLKGREVKTRSYGIRCIPESVIQKNKNIFSYETNTDDIKI